MKKILVLVLVLALMSGLVSCNSDDTIASLTQTTIGTIYNAVIKSDREYAEEKISAVVEAINKGDMSVLASLFAKNAQNDTPDFDESVKELLDFIEGDIVEYNLQKAPDIRERKHYEQRSKQMWYTFSIDTSSKKYYVYLSEYLINQFDPSEEGINLLFIIDAENWQKENYIYGPYDHNKFGITIDRNVYTEESK